MPENETPDDAIDWQERTGIEYGNAPNVSPERLMELRGQYCLVEYGTRRLLHHSNDHLEVCWNAARVPITTRFYLYPVPADLQLREGVERKDKPLRMASRLVQAIERHTGVPIATLRSTPLCELPSLLRLAKSPAPGTPCSKSSPSSSTTHSPSDASSPSSPSATSSADTVTRPDSLD